MPRVVIYIDRKGDWSVKAVGPVEIYCVDETAPNDRVYRMNPLRYTTSPRRLAALINGGKIPWKLPWKE